MLPGITQTQAARRTSRITRLWNMHLRRSTPDQAIGFDGSEIILSGRRDTVSKRSAVPIQGVCRRPGKGQFPSFCRIFQQFQRNFRLRFECQILRHSTCFSLLSVFCFQPLFRHEQPTFDQAISLTTGPLARSRSSRNIERPLPPRRFPV